ncbi:MAG: hypothetical protein CSA96_09080 [Bacteroidetes bacterium]|nr:MAG: hypothetical protein CSA96_09080 [Bacteroidota bacterium]
MKRIVLYSIGLLALLLNTSCESVLFIELDEADKLIVLNGAISADSLVAVQVSRTRHILDNAPVLPLGGARVKLYENGELAEELSYSDNAYFRSVAFRPSKGRSYSIEVEQPGYASVSAACRIPPAVAIEKIDTFSIREENDDSYYYGPGYEDKLVFDISFNDPAGEENYYLLRVQADRSYRNWRDTTVQYIDSLLNGTDWVYFVNDSTYPIFDIYRQIGFPRIESDEIVSEGRTSEGILFSDQLIDGKNYSFRGAVRHAEISAADSAVVSICLHSISEDYYRYLKTRQKHYEAKENYLAVPVIVYSNVNQGTGFFGGQSVDVYSFTTFIPEYGWGRGLPYYEK